jgi:predicted O-methyltransferase YrrM
MLENVLTDPSSSLTCVDPYQEHIGEEVKERFLANVARAGAADRVTLVRGFSQDKLRELPLDTYHIIYIDGDHRAAPVLEDAVLSWRLLKADGLMVFDDYRWEVTQPPAERPLMAIDFFAETFADRVEVVHRDYQLILRKTRSY